MTLTDWVANEMVKRLDRVLNHEIAWEALDYTFFEVENKRGFFFTSMEDSNTWWKLFRKEISDYVENRLMQVNGITFEELKQMEKKELELLVINNMAEEVLEEMPKEISWETPIVWTTDILKQSSLGKYMGK